MLDIKQPSDILKFMDNIEYGYIDLSGKKQTSNLKKFKTEYRTLSVEQILKYKIGTCIEQVLLMHTLLDFLDIPNKMFYTRNYDPNAFNGDTIQDRYIHCFILYYDEMGVHQIEHPDEGRRGIHNFKDENTAIKEINKIYIEMSGGISKTITEFYDVEPGLTFKQFNDYVNELENYKKLK